MSDWQTAKLGDLCMIQSGGTPRRSNKAFYGGDIPWAKIGDLNGEVVFDTEEYLTQEGLDAIGDRLFPEGTLLLAMYGSIGKLGIAGVGLTTNQAILGIQIEDGESLDADYLRHWFKYVQPELENQGVGVTQKNLSATKVRALEIPLPPLDEQHHIAAVLDRADALRAKRRRAQAMLDDLLRSTFVEMFGDPVLNPKGWPMLPLGSVGTLDRGKSRHRPRNAPELLGGPYPLIQTGEVANSWLRIETYTETYSELGLEQSKMWPQGTLCITIAANIADTGILDFAACFPDSVVGFTPDDSVTSEYVQLWLSFLQKTIQATAPEVAQKNINLKILRSLELPVPPIELQEQFSTFVDRLIELKRRYEKVSGRDDSLYQALAQRAFRGELTEPALAV